MSEHTFHKLEELGRVRLSKHFQMRQFLYSEIGASFGILNFPDNPDLAIEAGALLCETILEPLTEAFGPLIIRSGFRSARLNEFGASRGYKCASNKRNFAYHIWDHRDAAGHKGAAATIAIPKFLDGETEFESWRDLAWWIDDHLPYHRLTFFRHGRTFNIGAHDEPRREIFAWDSKPRWIKRADELPLKDR